MSVLKAIDQLLRQRPLSRRAVETLLGLPLREDTKNTNPTLRVYRSFRGEPPWQRVELRVPEPRKNGAWGSSRTDSLLVLELEPNAGQETSSLRYGTISARSVEKTAEEARNSRSAPSLESISGGCGPTERK